MSKLDLLSAAVWKYLWGIRMIPRTPLGWFVTVNSLVVRGLISWQFRWMALTWINLKVNVWAAGVVIAGGRRQDLEAKYHQIDDLEIRFVWLFNFQCLFECISCCLLVRFARPTIKMDVDTFFVSWLYGEATPNIERIDSFCFCAGTIALHIA